jgi:hypothetical protein
MNSIYKSFSKTYGLFRPRPLVQKSIAPQKTLVVQKLDSGVPISKKYSITKKHDAFVQELQEEAQALSAQPVQESSVIRALLTLAATDSEIQKKLKTLIEHDSIMWGNPKKEKEEV